METLVNGIAYTQEKDWCLVRERDQKRHFPIHKKAIESKKGLAPIPSIIPLSLNKEFVDPYNSYIRFYIESWSGGGQIHTLDGGYLSLIRNIVLKDKHGKEIDRCDNLHVLNTFLPRAIYGDTYIQDLDTPVTGWGTRNGSGLVQGEKKFVMIPLHHLVGLFRSSSLLPPHLMDGMEIWVYWSDPNEIFTQTMNITAPATWTVYAPPSNLYGPDPFSRYSITDLSIVMDSYVFNHSICDMLNEEYKTKGLPIRYLSMSLDTTKVTDSDISVNNPLAIPIVKAYTNATKIITTSRMFPAPTQSTSIDANYIANVLPNLIMLYDTVNNKQVYQEGDRDFMILNGRTYPRYPTNTKSEMVYHWKQTLGKNRYHLDPISTIFDANVSKGPSYIRNCCRNVELSPNSNPNLQHESNHALSGTRIDGTNPIDINLTLQDTTDFIKTDSQSNDAAQVTDITSATNFFRMINNWVEHVRYVNITPSGNSVYI